MTWRLCWLWYFCVSIWKFVFEYLKTMSVTIYNFTMLTQKNIIFWESSIHCHTISICLFLSYCTKNSFVSRISFLLDCRFDSFCIGFNIQFYHICTIFAKMRVLILFNLIIISSIVLCFPHHCHVSQSIIIL